MGRKKTLFKTEWFSLESEEFDDLPALGGKPFYRVNIPESVIVLAVTLAKEIIFVRQFRPAAKRHTLELPAGMIDKDETPEESAKRELYEETGYRCEKLYPLGKCSTGVDRLNATVFVFFGKGAVKAPDFIPEDGIEVYVLPLRYLKRHAEKEELRQLGGLGIILLARLLLNPEELKEL